MAVASYSGNPDWRQLMATPKQEDFILLDRSGSMNRKWTEALNSINVYVEELAKKPETKDNLITVAAFDKHTGNFCFDVLRRSVPVADFKPLTDNDSTPRGWTPLFDGVIQLVALADESKPDNCAILIMTDGEENASKEATRATADAALKRCRDKGWQVIFLGAEFKDVMQQAASMSNAVSQSMNMMGGTYSAFTASMATKRGLYASGALKDISFTEEEKEKLQKPPQK